MGRRQAELAQQLPPGIPVVRAGVDQDAVHVEDDRLR
jgi:hypothetical protein